MECKYCKGHCIKKGLYKGIQKYQCKSCKAFQRSFYRQRDYDKTIQQQVILLNNEGMSISSIGRILQMPKSSVQVVLQRAGQEIKAPQLTENGQIYEVDELHAFSRKGKPCYIIYAINRRTRQVIDFVIGARTKENISKVINKLLSLSPSIICTDRLPVFAYIIPPAIHRAFKYRINKIERKNLTLRTHLKRLSRKTICYSKSKLMLEVCFKLYIWREANRLTGSVPAQPAIEPVKNRPTKQKNLPVHWLTGKDIRVFSGSHQ